MGNFASSSEWVHAYEAVPSGRSTITPLPITATKPAAKKETEDILSMLVAKAISTCKHSIQRVLSSAFDKFNCSADIDSEMETEDDEYQFDDILGEFQIVYEDNYAPGSTASTFELEEESDDDLFKNAPWFQYTPCDFDTVNLARPDKWTTLKANENFDDSRSATTESSDWLSELNDYNSESPASPASSELDELDYYDENDDVETKAMRLLRLASSVQEETLLFVDDYLCKCGKCPLYEVIEDDVSRVAISHGPEELISLTRILQAFSTYNETIGYHPDMITTADECLRVWCGDEDQAFSSFVVLYDDVPFLCNNAM